MSIRFSKPAQSKKVIELHAAEVEDRGYTIIPDVLSTAQVKRVRSALDEVFESESDIAEKRHWLTDQYRVAYMLAAKNDVFRRLPSNPRILKLMERLLGVGVVVASTNGLTMRPGGNIQPLHRDQAMSLPGHVVTINALHCLDDFTKANGGTRLVPYSHKIKTQGKLKLNDPYEKDAIYVEAPAGSVIAYSGSLLHAGSKNTTNELRRAIHIFFTRSWYKPQWDFPHSLPPHVIASMTNREKHLFGFGTQPNMFDLKERKIFHISPPKRKLKFPKFKPQTR